LAVRQRDPTLAGPLIGGYVTTTWSWRYVFVGEVVVEIAVLAVHRRMKRAPKPEQPPKLDYGGAALSAVALGLIVFGILKSSTWGWIRPIAAPTLDGHEITPAPRVLAGPVPDHRRLRLPRRFPDVGRTPGTARPKARFSTASC
jgi:MFS family permease